MKQLTNEILNKYIDNELSSSELNELKQYISDNPGELEKFKAHKLVDDLLREMEHESAPENFTYNFMQNFSKALQEKKKKPYFIWAVFTFLGIGFISIFAYGIANLSPSGDSRTDRFIDQFIDGVDRLLPSVDSLSFTINPDLLMVIVSTLVLVTLLVTYGIINSHKVFKDKIENLSH